MGVTYLQHRIVTGSFATSKCKRKGYFSLGRRINGKYMFYDNEGKMITWSVFSIIYVYVLLLLFAGATKTACDITEPTFHRSYDIGFSVLNCWSGLLNIAVILILRLLYDRQGNGIMNWLKKRGCPSFKCKNRTNLQQLSDKFTIWTTLLNIMLVIICNPSMLNPGPNNSIKVMYQNVRGFVPSSGLSKSIMPLNEDKTLEFQSKVFNDKPDVIVLTETWLSKEHLDNEILPDSYYKIFRKDRSKRSHPPDPDDDRKYRLKGGGVLIAIRTDTDLDCDKINVNSKAEMLSVSLTSGNTRHCITVCYRVGNLGQENLNEIERHLGNIISRRKLQNHIVIGDFNFPQINWSSNSSPTNLGHNFIAMFNNFGFNQMVNEPTHEKGNLLDLLFTNTSRAVDNVNVLQKNEICSSDHFGITFNIKMKFKNKADKRKIFNYKKANWQNLNNDLKSVRWDQYLNCEPEVSWLNFKHILNDLMKKHIPTIYYP